MGNYNFKVFDKRSTPLVKRPEVTLQAKGSLSFNASAYHLLGSPEALELLYDPDARVIGFRAVDPGTPHAYPIRGVKSGSTYIVSGRAFIQYFGIPADTPVRRDVRMDGDVMILDLNDPGRDATSNRNRKRLVDQHQQHLDEAAEGTNGAGAITGSPGSSQLPGSASAREPDPPVGSVPDSLSGTGAPGV